MRQQLLELLEPVGLAELADEDDELEVVRTLVTRLAAIPEAVREEFSAS